jgi:hypothetical protein
MESLPMPHHVERRDIISPRVLVPKLLVWICRMKRWASCIPTHSLEHNWAQPLGRLNPSPYPTTKLKTINSELLSNTDSECGGGMLNLPQRTLSAKLSVNEHGKSNKCWEQGWSNKLSSQNCWTSTKQRSGEVQRLRAGVGQQANLPKWGKWWISSWSHGTDGNTQNWIDPPSWRRR